MHWRDRRTIKGILAGNESARTHLLEEIYPRIYAYLYHLSADTDLAADLAQEAALRIWNALPAFDPQHETSLKAWTHRIAYNTFIDALRARPAVQSADIDAMEPIAPQPEVADTVITHLESTAALAAVQRLPEHYRQVIVLRFLQDFAYREIAGILAIPTGTVRSRLAKALALLRVDLAEKEECNELRTSTADDI
jgi:RNA polymerase sigma factor (sigma-70 family)